MKRSSFRKKLRHQSDSSAGWITSSALICCCFVPLLRVSHAVYVFLGSSLPRSWDGSSHLAAAHIYDTKIFPDTFGWTFSWFGGMPFPNFYPPLFHCVVALLHHSGLPFLLSVKLLVVVPLLLIPSTLALLALSLTPRNLATSACTALVSCFWILDPRFASRFPSGLNYASTINEGLFTQPLGFILLALWVSFYFRPISSKVLFAVTTALLALTALESFFCAVSVLPFACVGLILGFQSEHTNAERNSTLAKWRYTKIGTLICAIALTAFWVVPVIQNYSLFVTRPLRVSFHDVVPSGFLIRTWYILGLVGAAFVFVRGSARIRCFTAGCFGLLALIVLSFFPIAGWAPSQPPRLVATFNLLLSVPIGFLLAHIITSISCVITKNRTSWATATMLLLASIAIFGVIKWPESLSTRNSVYLGEPSISGVLTFAQHHNDGRYIVENPWLRRNQYDARALDAYLAMQGNEVLTSIFHEASPESVFFGPVVNALSGSSDSFGISSALSSDMDFFNQSPEQHIAQAASFGVRYIVCITPFIKRRFRQEGLTEYPLGQWSAFELANVAPKAEILRFLPALVVSPIDFKLRNSNQYSFSRLAEEQMNSGFAEVQLAWAKAQKIDKLELDDFGALVLDTYDYESEEAAYTKLREFANHRRLILLSSNQPLYERLKAHLSELKNVTFIERQKDPKPYWFGATDGWVSLEEQPLRKEWRLIQAALDNSKIPVNLGLGSVSFEQGDRSFAVSVNQAPARLPILVRTTFHPSWERTDGSPMYATTPFFVLTFADRSFDATFHRTRIDKLALLISGLTLCGLVVLLVVPKRVRRRGDLSESTARSRGSDVNAAVAS